MKLMLLIYNILIIHVLTYKYQLRGMREIESAKEDINISYSEIKYLNNIQQLYDINIYKNSFYILLSKNKDQDQL